MDKSLLHRFFGDGTRVTGTGVEQAAQEIINKVHAYMRAHPQSELHRCGKMFGVLVCRGDGLPETDDGVYLAAFSAQLDGSYHHEGFVPPVYDMPTPPVGADKADSQRLQRLLFAQYKMLNSQGETRNLLEIFANEKPILSAEEWFEKGERLKVKGERIPPSGAGECCAPKLLQYAFAHGLKPLALGEFWVGAPPKNELRREGVFYPPCSGRCVPILRWMLGKSERIAVMGYGIPATEYGVQDIEVLYEDEWLMVVNKPAGLLTVPGKSNEPSLASLMSDERGIPILPAHRLDQDTSGLVVLAKDAATYKTLQAYFLRRDILKRYEAVVEGERLQVKGEREGIIDLPLLPNPFDRPRQMVDRAHGKPSITRYAVREQREDGTWLVNFYPQTGRTHQLRVHAAHPEGLNAPIVGDRLYGGDGVRVTGDGERESRLMLHAAEIRFLHPITNEEMHFCTSSGF